MCFTVGLWAYHSEIRFHLGRLREQLTIWLNKLNFLDAVVKAFWPPTSGLYPPLGLTPSPPTPPPPPTVAQFISPLGNVSLQPLKGQNCQFADKCRDATFMKSFMNNNMVNKIKHLLIQQQNSNWFRKKNK